MFSAGFEKVTEPTFNISTASSCGPRDSMVVTTERDAGKKMALLDMCADVHGDPDDVIWLPNDPTNHFTSLITHYLDSLLSSLPNSQC